MGLIAITVAIYFIQVMLVILTMGEDMYLYKEGRKTSRSFQSKQHFLLHLCIPFYFAIVPIVKLLKKHSPIHYYKRLVKFKNDLIQYYKEMEK